MAARYADTNSVATLLATVSDRIVEVLDVGQLDEDSRRSLARVNRHMAGISAMLTAEVIEAESQDDEIRWYRTMAHHVGSTSVLREFGWRASKALYDARLAWLDEIDSMSDSELERIPGIGRVSRAEIRATLNRYYWRCDPGESEQLWLAIIKRLRQVLDFRYLPQNERVRVLDGIALAERVLADRALADATAPRAIA